MAHPTRQSSPSTIRLWDPQRDPQQARPPLLSSAMTLTEFASAFFFPVCRESQQASQRTLDLDRMALRMWALYTGDPPMVQIDQAACAQFVKQLVKRPGQKGRETISPNTVRKLCCHLQTILDRAGPRTRRNRLGQGLFAEEPPYLERPKKRVKEATDNFTLNEIGAWLEQCALAQATDSLMGLDPARWWTALVVFIYNTALRIDTAMRLTWAMLDHNEPDWLDVPASIYKGGQHGLKLFVNRPARAAIEAIGSRGRFDQVFPWRNWPASQGWLQKLRRRMLAAAGLPAHRRFGFHGLRKALSNWVAPQNWALNKIILGHRPNDVTIESYVNPQVMRDILGRVPQPGRLHQKDLFGD